jgi:D-3-phosphoglycerate dehydrogenase / 2-oxoglutarate reductase
MSLKVLISAPYMQPVIERFRPVFSDQGIELVIPTVCERMEEEDLLPLIADIDGVICGDDRFTELVLASATKLKVISKWGTGIDSIDRKACAAKGVAVRNTPNAFSEPVADSVLGYMLCFARRLPWMTNDMREGVWNKIPGFALREATLGVIGVGAVGKAVVRRAIAFGMRILGSDIATISSEFINETKISMVPLEILLKDSDFISINCDLNVTSHHLMNGDRFKLVKPTAYLINTARGPIVDERSMIKALQEGKLAGAGLDVFEDEPLPGDSPLRKMDHVLLAPHNANSSPEAWERVHLNTIRNLFEALGITNAINFDQMLRA